MTPEQREEWEERAAIIEEGNPGMTREEAERLALRCVLKSEPEQTPSPWRQIA